MSAAVAGTPRPASCAAIADGEREALLVTNASCMPRFAASASASAAPWHRGAAEVDDPVQVQQGGVIVLAERAGAAPQASALTGPRGAVLLRSVTGLRGLVPGQSFGPCLFAFRARSVARTLRSASV